MSKLSYAFGSVQQNTNYLRVRTQNGGETESASSCIQGKEVAILSGFVRLIFACLI